MIQALKLVVGTTVPTTIKKTFLEDTIYVKSDEFVWINFTASRVIG